MSDCAAITEGCNIWIVAIAALAAVLGGCLPQDEQQVIVVDGEGVVMATPEVFKLSAILSSRGATKAEALSNVSASLAKISGGLPRLEGLTRVEIDPGSAELKPVYNLACRRESNYDQDAACPIEGYFAQIGLSLTGAPAAVAGNALSLLTEFGAEEAELSGYSVLDYNAVKSEAASAAMKDARAKAERLAAAAGATLGAPTRIQYGEGFDDTPPINATPAFTADEDQIIVTGSRIPAATNLVLTPQPFEVREGIAAAFALVSPRS